MNEQEYYIKATLVREIWHASHRIGLLQKQLEDAVAERRRLRQHLRTLEEQERSRKAVRTGADGSAFADSAEHAAPVRGYLAEARRDSSPA